jgi:hypothetical protein
MRSITGAPHNDFARWSLKTRSQPGVMPPIRAFQCIPLPLAAIDPRPNLRLGTDQPDQPADRPADAWVDLERSASVICCLNGLHNRSEPARVNKTELGQIHADTDTTDHELPDALVELADRREVQFAV